MRIFNAIWDVIKTWDVNVPEEYEGYCGANGNHVCAIMDAVALVTEGARAEGIGWAHADACVTLDEGGDPRKTNVPSILERANKDLGSYV